MPAAPPQDDKALAGKLRASSPDGAVTEGKAPGEETSQEEGPKVEQGDQTEVGEDQEKNQPADPGTVALVQEVHHPEHQEQEGRSQGELASLRAPSTPVEGGPSSPTGPAGHDGASQEVELALGSKEPLSDDERSSRGTGVKTAREDGRLSKSETAPSSVTPVDEDGDSVVSSALPGMIFEEESRPLSEHPLVSLV